MRTSGGAGASLRRLRDVKPGVLHPLTALLLTLLLLCPLVAAETGPPQREWTAQLPLESHVTVGADGLAASRGAGRRRSDGLSITRSTPVETGISADAAVDDQAIKFTPTRVDLGRTETCSPQRYYAGIENRGRVSVRLDGADFTHEGFSLANDVRGIRLDPGDRFNVEFVFLPREVEPNGVDAHLRVLTTSGLFALPISSPEVVLNRYGVSSVRASIPAGVRFEQSLQFINPLNYTIRITEMYTLDSVVHLELFNVPEQDGPHEVTVYKFKQRVVPAGAAWPKISLQVTPARHADLKCSDAMFLADCLLPLPPHLDGQTCEKLSDYGEFVDAHDLAALSRRNAFWSETRGSNHSTIEAHVQLQTDIMDDVANVTIMALLERALVTVPPAMSVHYSNDSLKDFEFHTFVLTELLHLSQIFVYVQNPSNISIQMELTIAAADQELFYSCDYESRAREALKDKGLDGEKRNDAEDIQALCLSEWRAIAADAVTLLRDNHVDVGIPPFYFQRKIAQVPAGEATQLGPIYYLPSKVQEVTTTMFVRNDLSHIEPVLLLARSGKGTLDLWVDAPASNSKSIKTHFAATEFAGVPEQVDPTLNSHDGILTFALTNDDASTDYSQSTKISLSNTGPFGLTIHSVAIEGDDDSWVSNDFLLTPDDSEHGEGNDDVVVLPPGKTAHFRVSFCASCFEASVASSLVIYTSDSVKRIRLQGKITTDAAFACLRSRMSLPLQYAFHTAWILAVAAAAISTLFTLLVLAHDAWTSGDMSEAQPLHFAVHSDDLVTESEDQDILATPITEEGGEALPRTLSSIHRLLEEMEQAAFAPPARVVTPAVATLLERRHKGLCSTNCSNLPSDDSKAVVSEVKAEKILRSDAASTATELSLQGAQEVVREDDSADAFAPSTPTPIAQPVSGSILNTPVKIVEAKDDIEHSDLASEEGNSESPEDFLSSSSHSTVVQSDAEESSHSGDFPKLMFGSPGGQVMHAMGSDFPAPIGTASQQKEEGPFEAFTSLSERWRAQDWQENLTDPPPPSRKFPGVEGWDGALSFNTLGNGVLVSTVGNQRDESAGSSRRSESGSFLGAGSGLYLDGFSTFATPPAPATSAKKAPPGFTPADAKPLETRAAFERLRGGETRSLGPTTSTPRENLGGSSLFTSKLPLFGPALPSPSGDHVMLGGVGRIGSGRSKVLRRELEGTATQEGDNDRRPMNIGGQLP
ncbi:hypothetical protein KRP22_003918 [Phytophthora ramorum]|nr:hypothetical protein KRP22_9851 [Phytophthora ramorum]